MKDVLLLLQLDLFQCMCCVHSYNVKSQRYSNPVMMIIKLPLHRSGYCYNNCVQGKG